MANTNRTLTDARIERYLSHLREQERSPATIQKYAHDLKALSRWLMGEPATKAALLEWKQRLSESYAPATVNAMLTAVNGCFRFLGWKELPVKLLRLQKNLFLEESRELTRQEYVRLVSTARCRGDQQLTLVIQTLCATGIRVSELRFITVEALRRGRAEVSNKGKRRIVFLPEKLRRLLRSFAKAQKITAGVCHPDGAAPEPVEYLAQHEGAVRRCRGSGAEGVPPQSAASVCPDFLQHGEGSVPAGGHSGAFQRQYHKDLHRRERRGPRPADGANGSDCHIISVLLQSKAKSYSYKLIIT